MGHAKCARNVEVTFSFRKMLLFFQLSFW